MAAIKIFDRLEKCALLAHSFELQRELRNMAMEGSLFLRNLSIHLDKAAMQDLIGWWTRAEQMLEKCEVPPGRVA